MPGPTAQRLFLLLAVALAACHRKAATIQKDPAPAMRTSALRVIASGQVAPWNVLADGDFVYWACKGKARTHEGAVRRVKKSSGAVETVADQVSSPFGLAASGDLVVWTEAVMESGAVVGKRGEQAFRVAPAGKHEPWALVARDGRVWWSDLLERGIYVASVIPGDSTVTKIAGSPGRPVGLAVDATHAYFTSSDDGSIIRVPRDGGEAKVIYSAGDKTTGLAIDDAYVYWAEWGSGRIARMAKSGGPATVLAEGQKSVRAVVVDETRVYFNHPSSGSIRSVPKTGGAVTTHVTGQKQPYSLTVDERSIYWANVDGDTVMAIDKDAVAP